ncbi:MAG: hypothetical protein ABIE22_01755 [archaeon]
MQKILSKEQKTKSEKRNKTILGVAMVALLVLSTAGYAFFSNGEDSESSEKKTYNGIDFYSLSNSLWGFKVDNLEFYTRYYPGDTENISVPFVSLQNYRGKNLYFVSEDSQAKTEIYQNMKYYIDRVQDVCFYDNCTEDLPIKNCSENIVLISIGNNTGVEQEENCIFIKAPSSEIIRASDAFIFKVLGIRKI